MARRSDVERLAELEERKRALEAQMQAIQARQRAAERKEETRRKVLAGAVVLAEAERNPAAKQRLMALLDQHLTRPVDRAVFGLPAAPEPGTGPQV